MKEHARECQCQQCVAAKFKAFKERVKMMSRWDAPSQTDQTIPVRAHWRRGKHLTKQPELKKLVVGLVKDLMKESP